MSFLTLEEDIEIGLRCARREGIEEGIERGRSEGENSKAMSIAKAMKEKGMDDNLVFELTGISLEV